MQSQNEDIDLWYAFKNGDRDAFGKLFRRYYSLLFQYGIKLSADSNVVEDCIQELFTELWQNSPGKEVRSVKAYLLTSIKYKIFKLYRNSAAKSFDENQDTMIFEISHENFIVMQEEDRQKTEQIINALKQLPPRQQEIVYLKIYQNLAYDEISEVMNINYQAARNLFSQSIKSLRKFLSSL